MSATANSYCGLAVIARLDTIRMTFHLFRISSEAALHRRTMKKRSWTGEHDTFQVFETIQGISSVAV